MSSTSNVNGNSTSGSSHQTNINITVGKLYGLQLDELMQKYTGSPSKERTRITGEVTEFFGSLKGPFGRGPAKVDSLTVSRGLTKPSFVVDFFPHLTRFQDDLQQCLKRYALDNEAAVVKSLRRQDREALESWLSAPESGTFLIYGPAALGRSKWTTDLALELLGANDKYLASDQSRPTNLALTYHFCGEKALDKNGSPEILVQDLLLKLLQSHGLNFSQHESQYLTKSRFVEAASSKEDLWRLFKGCILLAGIRLLVIVIDNIDYFYDECQQETTFRNLIKDIQALLIEQKDVTVKVLVTSSVHKATACLKQVHIEKFKSLQLDRAPDRRQQTAAHKIYR